MRRGLFAAFYLLGGGLVLALVVAPMALAGVVLVIPGLLGVGCIHVAGALMRWMASLGATDGPARPRGATPFEAAAAAASETMRKMTPSPTGNLRRGIRVGYRRPNVAVLLALALAASACTGYRPNTAMEGPTETRRRFAALVATWSERMGIEEPTVFFRRLPPDRCAETNLGAIQRVGVRSHQRYVVSFDTSTRCGLSWAPKVAVVHELCHQRMRHMLTEVDDPEREASKCADEYLRRERRGDYR